MCHSQLSCKPENNNPKHHLKYIDPDRYSKAIDAFIYEYRVGCQWSTAEKVPKLEGTGRLSRTEEAARFLRMILKTKRKVQSCDK